MPEKSTITLTREWIMVMLYQSPTSLSDLIAEGCRVMVFGHEYEDFLKIVQGLQSEGYISQTGGLNELQQKGVFYVKKHTLLPLIAITESPKLLTKFVDANKEKCDTEFLSVLAGRSDEKDKITQIKRFARQNYDKIAKILFLISEQVQ